MITIYRPTDKLCVNVGDMKIFFHPLSKQKKFNLVRDVRTTSKQEDISQEEQNALLLAVLRECIIEVEGFEAQYADGTKVSLEFEEGKLTEQSLYDLTEAIGVVETSEVASALLANRFESLDLVRAEKTEPKGTKKKRTRK